ncbi:hypothetical protein FRC01_012226, partial [Tulasnella sp. 417]
MKCNYLQPDPSGPDMPLTKEELRFQCIQNYIPVQFRPTSVPTPMSNLSTGANVHLYRLHRIAEDGRGPSENLEAVVFIDALSKTFAPHSAVFLRQSLVRISDDRKYGYVIGPNGFSDLELDGLESVKLLVFVLSSAAGGNRALGVYRSCNIKLLDITPDEDVYQSLPDE